MFQPVSGADPTPSSNSLLSERGGEPSETLDAPWDLYNEGIKPWRGCVQDRVIIGR